jgi:hypothetical protein
MWPILTNYDPLSGLPYAERVNGEANGWTVKRNLNNGPAIISP